jgi:thiol-disulfide isomerase/thioredoxin
MKRTLVLTIVALTSIFSCKNRVENRSENIQKPLVDSRGYIVEVGDSVPDFQIQYLDGRTEKLSDHKGKVIMIQFTASWCGVCRKEMPHIEERIWKKFSDNQNFLLIGIDFKEDAATTEKFSKDMKQYAKKKKYELMTNFYLKSGKDRFWVMKPFYEENILEGRIFRYHEGKIQCVFKFREP